MWLEKLTQGVLCVLTPLGPRYVKPSFSQRVYLLWVFRHFHVLPPQVLTDRQQRLIESLCANQEFGAVGMNPFQDAPVLGTVERRPEVAPSGAAIDQRSESRSALVRQRP